MARLVVLLGVFVLCLFKIQESIAACCFIPNEPCVYQTCGCPVTPAGIVACAGCSCDICNSCSITPTLIGCSTCDSCFRDTACPCKTCPEKPSPVCSCFQTLCQGCGCGSGCGCGYGCGCGCGCGCANTRIYFPEVEYPNTILEMNPLFFANCWRF